MKRYILLAISLILLITSTKTNGQISFVSKDTIVFNPTDSLLLKISEYRGHLQWQSTLDGKIWTDIIDSKSDSLFLRPEKESAFRAAIVEGNCDTIFSDTLVVKIIDLKSEITEKIDSLFPENITSLIQEEIEENKSQPDYDLYLENMYTAVNTLKDTVEKYYSFDELQQAILKFQSDFENTSLKSSASLGCNILNAGLGYAKGVSVNASVGAGVSYIISLGLKAQQGGGAEITYDFVNQTRQIYIYKMCSLSETFGAGIGGGFSGSLGVSGYIKWLTNIPFYQQNLMSRFAGPSKSQKIGLSGKFELGLGINPSISIGTSKGVEGDCDNVYNLFECPVYFNNQTPKINGVTSIITTVSGAVSAGASSELVAAFSNENGVSCSSGISESYVDYKNGGKNRMYAALKMASEIIINSPIMGLTAVGSSFDLIAASAAITYATIDVENCPITSFATVTTNTVTSITQTTAICGGNITSEGGSKVTDRGVCWNTVGSPTPADNHTFNLSVTGSFTANLNGLTANTTYYARAYATNSAGTAYGNEVTFTTSSDGNLTGTFTDSRDGHVYKTIKIGNQTWMAENLAYLPSVSPSSAESYTEPYYYVYGYEGTSVAAAKQNANYTTYGVLYNWPAALTACPPGWHLPTDDEWTALTNFLGGEGVAGGKMKETGTARWNSPNTGATNESGFSALPGGYRDGNGYFDDVGIYGEWWSATETSTTYAWGRALGYNFSFVSKTNYYKGYGFSVRCVRD